MLPNADHLPPESEYDEATGTLCIPADVDGAEIPPAIITGVEAISGTDVKSLTPLSSVINPDALDVIFSTNTPHAERRSWVSFPYEGYRVTVYSEGFIEIEPMDRSEPGASD